MAAWVRRHDRQERFELTPFQTCPSPPMTPRLLEESRRAVQVLAADGRRLSAGRAALFVLVEIGWHPALSRVASHRPLIWLVEGGYRLVARHRSFFARWFFRGRD